MKINQLAFLAVAATVCSTMAFAGVHRRADNPPPPPDVHERLCDGGNCCNLDVDGRSLDYTLRCDHPFKDADLYVGNHRPEKMRISTRGRLQHPIDPRESKSIKINYPPKRDLHKRLCDRDNCCNLDVDGNSLNYTLRCDHPFKDADLYIGKHRPEQVRIYDRGRLPHEIKQNEHLDLRINYAPPPPPPHHNPHERNLNNKHRR